LGVTNKGDYIDRQLATLVGDSATDIANAPENKTVGVHFPACLDG
jgi:hypothetical protein